MTSIDNYMYWFMQWVEDGKGNAYFSAVNDNNLYKIDLKTNKVNKICQFRGQPFNKQLYRGGLFSGDNVYFPPRMADKMAVYNTITSELSYVDMNENYTGNHRVSLVPNNQGYISLKDIKGNCWFIYRNSPVCVRMDPENGKFDYITCEETGKEYILGTEYLQLGNLVYIPVKGKNLILKLDMYNCSLELLTIGKKEEMLYSLTLNDDGCICMLSYNEPGIVSWDPDADKFRRIADLPLSKIEYEKELIIRSAGDHFRVFPGLDLSGGNGCVYTVEKATGAVKKETLFESYEDNTKYIMNITDDKFWYFMSECGEDPFMTQKGRYVLYDCRNNRISETKLSVPEGETTESMSKRLKEYDKKVNFSMCCNENITYLENRTYDFSCFLSGVLHYDKGTDA